MNDKLTLEKLMSLKVGDSVCDMHYGLPEMDETLRSMMDSAFIDVEAAEFLIDRAQEASGRSYMNKMLVVVAKPEEKKDSWTQCGVTCAYAYDGRYAKVISFGLKRY